MIKSRLLVNGSYLALIFLQPVWHALLPPPLGAGSGLVAVLATLPLLLPLKGLLRGSLRSMTWAGYLVMLWQRRRTRVHLESPSRRSSRSERGAAWGPLEAV